MIRKPIKKDQAPGIEDSKQIRKDPIKGYKESENLSVSYELTDIASYTHQGKREYQEDNYYSTNSGILVADGVGGASRGDMASLITTEVFAKALREDLGSAKDAWTWVTSMVNGVLARLNKHANENPDMYGMGSTMAGIFIFQNTLFATHIGDSRIYHFSTNGDIKWKSKDHSLVRELIDSGIITEEQASTHPQRNVITRVLQAKKDNAVEPSVHELINVEEGDRLLVCTDGVLESWEDLGLQALFGSQKSNADIVDELSSFSEENSRDNNTAIVSTIHLIPFIPGNTSKQGVIDQADRHERSTQEKITEDQQSDRSYVFEILILVLLLILLGWFFIQRIHSSS